MKEQSFILERGVRNFTRIVKFLSDLPKDIAIKVTIAPVKKERSDLQNRALWGCAYKAICTATGNDAEDIHELMCGEYFGWREKRVLGKRHLEPMRTTTKDQDGNRDVISTIHLSDFYEFIQRYAAEKAGVFVPDPDPEWFRHEERQVA